MPAVQFAELPQRSASIRQWHSIVWPKGRSTLNVTCVGDKIVKVYCHWDPALKRPRPCPGVEDCEACLKMDRRVYGYIAAVTSNDRDRVVAEFSAALLMRLRDDNMLDKPLRGVKFHLFRKKPENAKLPKPNDPVYYHVFPPNEKEKLPEKFSVMPSLLRLWGWTEEHLSELKEKAEAERKAEPNCLEDFLRQTGEIPE